MASVSVQITDWNNVVSLPHTEDYTVCMCVCVCVYNWYLGVQLSSFTSIHYTLNLETQISNIEPSNNYQHYQ